MVRQEHPVFTGRDEVDADGVLAADSRSERSSTCNRYRLCSSSRSTVTVRIGVVNASRDAIELVLVGEIFAIGAGGDERLHDFARMAAPLDDLQQLLVRDHLVEQLLELGAGDLDPLGRDPHDAGFGARLMRNASSSRSSLM